MQHSVLVGLSLWFYMSWNPRFVALILFTVAFDWAAALLLQRTASVRGRKAIVVASLTVNLGVLGLFKYANFFLDQIEAAGSLFGLDHDFALRVILPVGVSFYTFESMSYVVDVYRRLMPPIRNPIDYAVFITFFPHLVAGPIVRVRDFAPQLLRAMTPQNVHVRRAFYLFLPTPTWPSSCCSAGCGTARAGASWSGAACTGRPSSRTRNGPGAAAALHRRAQLEREPVPAAWHR